MSMSGWRGSGEFADAEDLIRFSQQDSLPHKDAIEDLVYLLDNALMKYQSARLQQPYVEAVASIIKATFGFITKTNWVETVHEKVLMKLLDAEKGVLFGIVHYSPLKDAIVRFPLKQLPEKFQKLLSSGIPALSWFKRLIQDGTLIKVSLSNFFWIALAHQIDMKATTPGKNRISDTLLSTSGWSFMSSKRIDLLKLVEQYPFDRLMSIQLFFSLVQVDPWLPREHFAERLLQCCITDVMDVEQCRISPEFSGVYVSFTRNFYSKVLNLFGTGSLNEANRLLRISLSPLTSHKARFNREQKMKYFAEFAVCVCYYSLLESMRIVSRQAEGRVRKNLLVSLLDLIQVFDNSLLDMIDQLDGSQETYQRLQIITGEGFDEASFFRSGGLMMNSAKWLYAKMGHILAFDLTVEPQRRWQLGPPRLVPIDANDLIGTIKEEMARMFQIEPDDPDILKCREIMERRFMQTFEYKIYLANRGKRSDGPVWKDPITVDENAWLLRASYDLALILSPREPDKLSWLRYLANPQNLTTLVALITILNVGVWMYIT